ncbi:MAG: Gfo/Idh/MocA family oxidoreductase [Fusobacteriaceae bacterium]|nr:Gfo/Idh/MocA family oxidoreductase [Fusobacteriaceae bacterium]
MKIGIVGSGFIIKDCLEAIKESNKIEVVSICVRENSLDKARKFMDEYSIPKVYTDYEEFLEDREIEFVYIGIINSLHYSYAKKALEHNKNVICEKPFTENSEELKELIEIAKEKRLYLFEAITTIHLENFDYIKENISKVGEIKIVQCNFSQYSSRYDKYKNGEVLPVFDPKLNGGALYDINIYNIHLVAGLFGEPKNIEYFGNKGFNGVDTSGILMLDYDKFKAVCIGAKDSGSPNFIIIQGDEGYIKINSAINLIENIEVSFNKKVDEINNNVYNNRMTKEFLNFKNIFDTDNFIEMEKLLNHSFLVMKMLEKAKKSFENK